MHPIPLLLLTTTLPVAAACRACYWLSLDPRNLALLVDELGVPALLLAAMRAILTAPAGYDPCLFSSFSTTLCSSGTPMLGVRTQC